MAFDPDKYLASKPASAPAKVAKGFDPDAYLASQGNIINTDVPTVVGQVPNPPPVQTPKRTMMDRVKALYEVPLTAASAAVAGPVSSAYGVYKSATSPQFGTPQGTQVGQQAANEMARRMTYTPTSPVAQEFLQDVSQVAEAAKLPPIIPTTGMLPSYARMAGATQPMVSQGVQQVREGVRTMPEMLRRQPEPTMSGVGSAAIPESVTRTKMAEQLRVPVPLSKGQAERDLGQQQFEIETAKTFPDTVGKPLIEAQARRNDAILQNFEAFIDATGKQTFGLEPTGKVVTQALANQAKDAKKAYREAYTAAQKAGQTNEFVDITDVMRYVNSLEAEEINAPIIQSARVKLNNLAQNNQISINSLEEVRKMINRLSGIEPQNQYFGGKIKEVIDAATEGKGGDLYQNARKLRQEYSQRFEKIGAINRLLTTKPNSTDRTVAFEDVFQKSIINGTLDDVKNLGYALKKGGPEGQQALRELRGQTIEYLKDKVTQSIEKDIYGNPVVSPAKFKTAVRQLDQDGKLDYLFGKKGAQEIRDLMEVTIMVNAPVKGAANYSNTASALIGALDRYGAGIVGKLPFGIGQIAEYSFEKAKQKELAKKVQESINYSPSKMAEELKKGSKK